MLQLMQNGIRWQLESDFAPFLDSVLAAEGRIIKESPAKQVSLRSVPQGDFYVKVYRHQAVLLRSLKYFLKRSEARQEWELAQQLKSWNAPVVPHLALGERWSRTGLQESILITAAFDGNTLAEASYDAVALLAFVHRLHEHGVLQHDLHAGNILVGQDPKEFRLVDLYHTEIKPGLSDEEKRRNLAFLNLSAPFPVSSEVKQLSAQLGNRLLRDRSARSLKTNRDFLSRTVGNYRWKLRLPIAPQIESILADPELFFASASLLKNSPSSKVAKLNGIVVKRHTPRPLGRLKDFFRRSRAWRGFRTAYHLELLGIPTAKPLAAAEQRRLGLIKESYFFMAEIHPATPLLKSQGNTSNLRSVAALVAALHQGGYSHRDLKHSNILIDPEGRAHIIDLDGLHFYGTVPPARVEADLDRLFRNRGAFGEYLRANRNEFMQVYKQHLATNLREAFLSAKRASHPAPPPV